ncbi:MAG: tRNA (adenosine(37)-N6)-threonylcarbamoyltransferase complex ATPase subunit type 1 TsaE, partial [Desulfovibrionaceae bacterium]|nr:tRNA (adenosine(37)-N6)-threonylcarbamoyltransferase complex ATPase subunit type 1 TsaE [Desulfovibrionaceae bacterium]
MSISLTIRTIDDVQFLANQIAHCLLTYNIRYFLCSGDYGVGKTTLIRYIVSTLPSTIDVEISSPSFTTYNIYPTEPPCIHIDLYNTPRSLFDIVEEIEESDSSLILVEWAEYSRILPDEPFFSCIISYATDTTRIIRCSTHALDNTILC